MAGTTRYSMLLDETAVQHMERLRKAYGLQNNAEVYDFATRLLTWVTEQRVQDVNVVIRDPATDERLRLILPQEPNKEVWARTA